MTSALSYWRLFRIVYVVFCCYLMGDAFYRWDGFSYYASFQDFIPAVALVTIIWTAVSAIVTFLLWGLIILSTRLLNLMGLKIAPDHILVMFGSFIILTLALWAGRNYQPVNLDKLHAYKQYIVLVIALISFLFAYILRNRGAQLLKGLNESLSPAVWLFGFIFVISFPVVIYQNWLNVSPGIPVVSEEKVQSIGNKDRPNIILVTFDALTSKDMSVYGYDRDTTPFLKEWSENATLFKHMVSESNYTSPTTASLMTGKKLWTHQLYHPHGSKPDKAATENLPLMLKKSGYYTLALVANNFAAVDNLGISDGYDIAPLVTKFSMTNSLFKKIDVFLYDMFAKNILLYDWIIREDFITYKLVNAVSKNITDTQVPAEKTLNSFLSFLDSGLPEPYFAWIHLYPPHEPYLASEPFMGMYDSSPELRTFQSQLRARLGSYGYIKQGKYPDDVQQDVDRLRARYDEFIRYCDDRFEKFIGELEKRGADDNTFIMLSSDHGESFEHVKIGHGATLYEPEVHIPMIIKAPGQKQGLIVHNHVEQVDITSTIADLAGIEIPEWMEGQSLSPFMRGEAVEPRSVISMALEANRGRGYQITKGKIAVWEGEYKLIYYVSQDRSELFNLNIDPDEMNDISGEDEVTTGRLLSVIKKQLAEANKRIAFEAGLKNNK
ncbi:MAG: sulfatase-like hydrolase/transferase [Nitrospira sp.]|nr:sulfatase-like hydrolase/transferase [Candidatus Brocadiales bacterium]MBL7049765.1 sulfatase-like hydrolase/transferase [Nitrospira sp.]